MVVPALLVFCVLSMLMALFPERVAEMRGPFRANGRDWMGIQFNTYLIMFRVAGAIGMAFTGGLALFILVTS